MKMSLWRMRYTVFTFVAGRLAIINEIAKLEAIRLGTASFRYERSCLTYHGHR